MNTTQRAQRAAKLQDSARRFPMQIGAGFVTSLRQRMEECEQTPGQNILQHGESVYAWFSDLIGEKSRDWKLPTWFTENIELYST